MDSYWTKVLNRQTRRRRFLAGAGGLTASAAFLAACGSGDDDDGGPTAGGGTGGGATGGGTGGGATGGGGSSGLLTQPVDTSSQAKRGGALAFFKDSEPPRLDDYGGGAGIPEIAQLGYQRIFKFAMGHLEPATDVVVGDGAESWEVSPDGLEILVKIRPDLKFHNVEPVSGRTADVEDVVYGWQRFIDIAASRGALLNEVNSAAPVQSLSAVDDQTISIKLAFELAYAEALFAGGDSPYIYPKEAADDSVLDLNTTMVGTGPYYLDSHTPSVEFIFKRHPDYVTSEPDLPANMPYIDEVRMPVITEYTTSIAQFRSGAIHYYDVAPEDTLDLKDAIPELNLYDNGYIGHQFRVIYGLETPELHDERVRQAISMTLDRNAFIETVFGTTTFEDAGLPVEKRWNSHMEAEDVNTGWWLDPQDSEFGENAKYFQLNIEEANKLLSAAGYSDGLDVVLNIPTVGGPLGPLFPRHVEILDGMMREANIRTESNVMNQTPDWKDNISNGNGKFAGISHRFGPNAPTTDPVDHFAYQYIPGTLGYNGLDMVTGDPLGDPHLDEEIKRGLVLREPEERRALVHDLQRYLAPKMWTTYWPGGATQFMPVWPAVMNFNVFRFPSRYRERTFATTWWIDETKPPFA